LVEILKYAGRNHVHNVGTRQLTKNYIEKAKPGCFFVFSVCEGVIDAHIGRARVNIGLKRVENLLCVHIFVYSVNHDQRILVLLLVDTVNYSILFYNFCKYYERSQLVK